MHVFSSYTNSVDHSNRMSLGYDAGDKFTLCCAAKVPPSGSSLWIGFLDQQRAEMGEWIRAVT